MDSNLKESLSKLLKSYNTMHSSSDAHDSRYLKISNIMNNGATNQPGFALDARQANPNESGSMAQKIASLEQSDVSVTENIQKLDNRISGVEEYQQWGTF